MALAYGRDFGINMRIARFHNIYGPRGTWKGGREKAPAAFCRKAITSTKEFEMWGDGMQVRRGRGALRLLWVRLLLRRGCFRCAGAWEVPARSPPRCPSPLPPPNHPPRQTRSFTFIDDCVEGVLRLMFSDCDVPINLGSTEMVSMNE
jgi:GDP-D-mannose 3',5'-epimerase